MGVCLVSEQFNFTKKDLDHLDLPPAGKRIYFRDSKTPGLQLMVTDKGTKTFYLYKKIQGRPTRIKLGHYPDITPNKARSKAYKTLGKLADGIDPTTQKKSKRAEKITLLEVLDDYLKYKKLKDSTIYDYRNTVTNALGKWLHRPIITITPEKVMRKHRKLTDTSGPAYANNALRILRALYNYVRDEFEDEKGRSLFPENPVRRLSQTRSWNRLQRRQTVIHSVQLPKWWEAVNQLRVEPFGTPANTVGDFLLVLLFTGLRRMEAAKLKKTDIELDAQRLIVRDTKNHETHVLPLTDFLFDLFQSRMEAVRGEYIFPGNDGVGYFIEPRAQIQKVINASGVTFTPHDLRRTFATAAEEIGVPPYTLKRLLNHKMGDDVTAGYVVSDLPMLRGPMQSITDALLAHVDKKPLATVTKITQRYRVDGY